MQKAIQAWATASVLGASVISAVADTFDQQQQMIMVDGLAVDSMGLKKSRGLEDFSSLPRQVSELPEFQMAPSLFTREVPVAQEEVDGYFPVMGRNVLGGETKQVDWFKALSQAEKEVTISPENMESVKGVALLSAVMKNYEKADEFFELYMENRPDDAAYRAAWAHVMMFRKKFPQAAAEAATVLRENTGSVPAHFTYSCARYGMGEDVDAGYWSLIDAVGKMQVASWLRGDSASLRKALGPDSVTDLSRIMIGGRSGGNLPLVIDSLRKGELAFLSKDYKQALVYYESAKRYGVESAMMFQNMAMCYFEIGKAEEALDILAKLTRVMGTTDSQVWFRYGYILLQQELWGEAELAFEQAISIGPKTRVLDFAHACALAGGAKMDAAWLILERLASADPEQLKQWLDGEKSYLGAIRNDSRFGTLL